ncbi:MAG: ABC transporter ATP-binding protein [Planctomycetota bacterium]|jgi:phospholipid/cholesterol/gamma-HCH transport system ATP-binding protein
MFPKERLGEELVLAQGVAKYFGARMVLEDVNLSVCRGETLVIMGCSGAGKTTMLRILMGQERPDRGRVLLFGRNLYKLDRAQLETVRRRFGVVFQSGALLNSLTVAENVALPLRELTKLPKREIRKIVHRKLREVAAGLDPVMTAAMTQKIRTIRDNRGVASVVVTHDMASAFEVGDRMVMLHDGRVLAQGTPDEIRASHDPAVRQFVDGESDGPITMSSGKASGK